MLPHVLWVLPTSALCLAGAFASPVVELAMAFLATATGLFVASAVVLALGLTYALRAWMVDRTVRDMFAADRSACFTTDGTGRLIWRNDAAARGGLDGREEIAELMGDLCIDPVEMLHDLMERVGDDGYSEDVIMVAEGTNRISATLMGRERIMWKIETADQGEGVAPFHLRVERDGTIVFVSAALQRALPDRPRRLSDLFAQVPLRYGAVQTLAMGKVAIDVVAERVARRDGTSDVILVPVTVAEDAHGFDNVPVPMLEIARDGHILRGNHKARQLLEIAENEAVTLTSLVEGLGRPVGDWLADAFAGRLPNKREVLRASRPAAEQYVQITLERRRGIDGPMIAILQDATELKTLEAQFVQSQKMHAIGQLAGGVAHDFNNLLTAISGHCDLLLLRHEPTDQNFADLEQINQNANRAASLVGQLLAFSRKQNLRPESLDLRDILAELTHLLNRLVGERVTLSFDHDPALEMVRADKRQIEQVIMNLVVNARDAMPNGGSIAVRTEMQRVKRSFQRDRVEVPPGDYVLVRVIDEGIGIPPDKLSKIFEPFFTTKRTGEGTGLGLSTAYGIVKQTGGYIFADSVVGEGTTFTLYFPAFADQRPVPAPAELSASAPETHGDGVVLLVEDEAPVRAFAARALRLRGYTVLEAENAENALEVLSDPDLEVDVFVTDVIMPGRDGPSWVLEALESRPDTKVIFVSGYAEESFAENQALIPHSVFLPKPFSLVELTSTVAAQFET